MIPASTGAGQDSGDYLTVYADRLRVQGPEHLATITTLRRLLDAGSKDSPYTGTRQCSTAEPGDLPDGVDPDDVHMESDHDELLADVLVAAVEFQDHQVRQVGPDDPASLRATLHLAHAMAAANQYEGQRNTALVLVEDARDGLEDRAARSPEAVTPMDLLVCETLHHWVLDRLGDDPTY